jgi:hypothetical protein
LHLKFQSKINIFHFSFISSYNKMLGKKFLFMLFAILVGIYALCNTTFQTGAVVENFWGGASFSSRAIPGAIVNGQEVALPGNFDPSSMMGSKKFFSTPNFQANLSPRFSNIDYGANIRYNAPDRKNMGVPCSPMEFGNMAKENYNSAHRRMNEMDQTKEGYCGSASAPSCGKGGVGANSNAIGSVINSDYNLPAGYANGNFNKVYESLPGTVVSSACGSRENNSDLPLGTMTTMDSNGDQSQFIAFDRIMPANNKGSSRLRSQGDPIRGDLNIAPCAAAWFSVYPNLARDVQEGAMNVLAGAGGGGDNYNALMKTIVQASGGTQTTLGGVDLSSTDLVNIGVQNSMIFGAGNSDISVSAFP